MATKGGDDWREIAAAKRTVSILRTELSREERRRATSDAALVAAKKRIAGLEREVHLYRTVFIGPGVWRAAEDASREVVQWIGRLHQYFEDYLDRRVLRGDTAHGADADRRKLRSPSFRLGDDAVTAETVWRSFPSEQVATLLAAITRRILLGSILVLLGAGVTWYLTAESNSIGDEVLRLQRTTAQHARRFELLRVLWTKRCINEICVPEYPQSLRIVAFQELLATGERNFQGLELRGVKIAAGPGGQLGAADSLILRGAVLHDWEIAGTSIDELDLRDAVIEDMTLSLESVDVLQAEGSTLSNSRVEGLRSDETSLVDATLRNVSFSSVRFPRSNWKGAVLEGHVELVNADLWCSNWRSTLTGGLANIVNSGLEDAVFSTELAGRTSEGGWRVRDLGATVNDRDSFSWGKWREDCRRDQPDPTRPEPGAGQGPVSIRATALD